MLRLFILLLPCLLLFGCNNPPVYKKEAQEAEKLCKQLGGGNYNYFFSTWRLDGVGDIVCDSGLVIKEHKIVGN